MWYHDTVTMPFEYLDVPVPVDFEKVLGHQFGDWHQFVKGTSYHNDIIQDPDVPYTKYLKDVFGYTDGEIRECERA